MFLVKLQNSKHSGKNVVDSLISQKEFFSSVFTTFASSFCLTEDSILAEINCQLAVSEFVVAFAMKIYEGASVPV